MSELSTGTEVRLTRGGELRLARNGAPVSPARDSVATVVCVNGGQAREVGGTWSATVEWLVRRLSPRLPELTFAEVRYRVKSWKRLDSCIADAEAAVHEIGGSRTVLLGFSMGGAVAVSAAAAPSVRGVVGLAPWLPDALDVTPMAGKELVVLHGALDRWLPGVPGVSPALSRRGFERARALGARGRYVMIPGALHGVALRSPGGRLLRLPRAERWAELVEEELRLLADL